jgi:hypothetical protein
MQRIPGMSFALDSSGKKDAFTQESISAVSTQSDEEVNAQLSVFPGAEALCEGDRVLVSSPSP